MERRNQESVAEALEDARPDVIAVWNIGAMSLGILTALIESGLPIVYAICDDWLLYSPILDQWAKLLRPFGRVAQPLRRLMRVPTTVPDLGSCGAFCFISEFTRQRALQLSRWRFPRTAIVYSGIERSLFSPEDRHRPWLWRLLYVGRVDPRKGIETAIRGLAELPVEARLAIEGVGGAAERTRLETLAGELGVADRIEWGDLRRNQLGALYREADVFLFPSEWEEPFGLVPLQAMACGTPVVATGV